MVKGFLFLLFLSLFCLCVRTCISIAVSYNVSPLLESHLLLCLTTSMLKILLAMIQVLTPEPSTCSVLQRAPFIFML